MRVACIHPQELDASLQAQWRALQMASPRYGSPYLHPRFALLVGAQRSDARVLVIEDGGRIVGFWGLHKRPDGFGRPLGQPLADENGPVLHPEAEIDLPASLRAAGFAAAAFTGAPAPPQALARFVADAGQTARLDVSAGGPATLNALRAAHARHFKNMRRKERKAIEASGPIRFVAQTGDRATLRQLMAWKRAQFARTGLYDVFAPAWTRALIASLAEESDAAFGGVMAALYIGDRLAAAEFSLRGGAHLHSWIIAYDPQFSSFSPGHLINLRMIEGADALGARTIDFGVGAGHYKRFYANAAMDLARGVVTAASVAGTVHRWRSRLWRAAETATPGPVGDAFGRLRRRTEIIVSAELSLGGRARGLAQAVLSGGAKTKDADAAG
jgi:CelD/BcsL family acetyltransferase involved in cellulose biosynthesis